MSTSTQDLIFQVAKANVEAARAAYESGYAAGHHQGYMDGLAKAKEMVKDAMPKDAT